MSFADCFPDPEPLRSALLDWFALHGRSLPWRTDCEPYHVWVSEIMLQQTQMERGVACYLRWMERFPTLAALAAADEPAVLKAWEGLGYYPRARNMLKAAKVVMAHGGTFPSSVEGLLALPGIGPYTAAAVASIAFNVDAACVDANVERVICRLCDLEEAPKREPGRSLVASCARDFLTPGKARWHNQAVMELGALVCGRRPDCPSCPLAPWCLARQRGTAADRPNTSPRPQRIRLTVASGLLCLRNRIYVQRRLPDDVWGGLWEFPGGGREGGEDPSQTIVREFREETGFHVHVTDKLIILKTNYTRFLITMHFYTLALEEAAEGFPEPVLTEADDWRWARLDELGGLAMPSLHRKLADSLVFSGDGSLRTTLGSTGGPLAALLHA